MRGARAPLVEEEESGPRRTFGRAWVPLSQRRAQQLPKAAAPQTSPPPEILVPEAILSPPSPILLAASEDEVILSSGSPSSLPSGRISVEDWRESITITADHKDEFVENIILDEDYSNGRKSIKCFLM
jgi:hypothetical protein